MDKDKNNQLKISSAKLNTGLNTSAALSGEYERMIDSLSKPLMPSISDSIINSARDAALQHERMIKSLRKSFMPSLNESLINSARAAAMQHESMLDVLRRPLFPSITDSIINSARDAALQHERMIKSLHKSFMPSLNESLINSARAATIQYESLLEVLYKPSPDSVNEPVKPVHEVTNSDNKSAIEPKQFGNKVDAKMSAEILSGISINRVIVDAVQELSKSVPADAESHYIEAISDLVNNLPTLSQKASSTALKEYLSKVPRHAQFILWFLISCVIYPYMKAVLDDIAVSLTNDNLKPIIKTYICEQPWATNKIISSLICSSPQGHLASNRFVNADFLYVRKRPNQKSEVVDLLPRFEVVTLIKKSENFSWSLIRYKNNDGEIIEGWVFSRYLYKPQL